MTSALSSRAC
ncbi:hypothetical protein VTL71DRAFT_2972 [Oculimacula yallundae]|uniref:Uncharacterized protein n=1 Tax=Oculimacula yallundae TaxID=86028 RepID=A0ABR4C832_9HELO